MNKKDELKLQILSNIKSEIIDKQSEKRYRLMNRKKMPKWVVPSTIAAASLVIICTVLLTVILPGLGIIGPDVKQVPIYQGMTVITDTDLGIELPAADMNKTLSIARSDSIALSNNSHGHHKWRPTADVVKDEMTLDIPKQNMYYALPNQDIYINVHISNPDQFEILSFTLNGVKYQSYMFEDGSNSENLILKVSIGSLAGIVEYTIDAIKYIDGTEIKDVIMEGDRTVRVGVYSENQQPEAQISNEVIGINKISFNVSLKDKLRLISICGGKAYAVILDAESIIYKKELSLTKSNEIVFEALETNTDYRYAIVAEYDSLDGSGFGHSIIFEKEFTTEEVVAFDSVIICQENISFALDWNEKFANRVLKSLSLYKDGKKIKDINVSATTVEGLLSNNEYVLVAEYENNGVTETTELTFVTEAKAVPQVNITADEITQESFKFDVAVTDVDSVGAITNIELIHGERSTNIEDLATREFTDLFSNNTYTVKVIYTYDLNDGVGKQTVEATADIVTEAKAEPTFTIKDMTSDTFTVNGAYDKTDIDGTLISYSVKLFKGDELVIENTDQEITFDSLDYYTDYTVKIIYAFDVNDGKGVQEKAVEQKIKTYPYTDVSSIISRTTSAVYDGDTIYFQANIINPCGIKVTHVNINGKKYAVSSASDDTNLFIEIVCDETLGGGNVEFKIDRIYADIENVSYEIAVDSEASATVFINGKFELLEVEFVNEQYEPIYWRFPEDKTYIKFTFNNPTGYDISKITINGSYTVGSEDSIYQLTKINDNEYIVEDFLSFTDNDTSDNPTISTVDVYYENQYASNSVSRSNLGAYCIYFESNEVKYISTPEEFIQAITETDYSNRAYYKLAADIDLSGKSWDRVDDYFFYGVIDGNGYAIKNYTVTGDWKLDWFGMFRGLYGGVINLDFENAFIMLKRNDVDLAAGLLTYENRGLIQNCTIDNKSIINMTGRCDFSFGGFAYSNGGTIEGCINNANVSARIAYGAIAYYSGGGTIKNCVNNGNISVGTAYGIAWDGVLDNCTNNGNIQSYMSSYGISYRGTLTNCTNNGDILASKKAYGISYQGTLTNCTNNGNISAIAQSSHDNDYLIACGISDIGTEINCVNTGTVTAQRYVSDDE